MSSKNGEQCGDHVFRSTVRIRVPLHLQREALEILSSVSQQIQSEPGCISSRLYQSVNDTRTVMMEDVWANREEMQHHFRSDAYRRVLLVVEMAEKDPLSKKVYASIRAFKERMRPWARMTEESFYLRM